MNIPPPCLDEKLWRICNAMRLGKLDEWSFTFMKSVLGQAKRSTGWKPSTKQGAIIDNLLAEVSKPAGHDSELGSLIDHGDLFTMEGV